MKPGHRERSCRVFCHDQNASWQVSEKPRPGSSVNHADNMKILGVVFLGLLATSEVRAEGKDSQADREEYPGAEASIMEDIDIIDFMKERGWNVEGLTKVEIGGMTAFQRAGKYVGYCVVESEMRQVPPEKIELPGVTRIEFGNLFNRSNKPVFVISDPKELELWVAACRNHSRAPRYSIRFVSLSTESGFKDASVETSFSIGHSPSVGLYFYRGDDEVLYFPAKSLGSHSNENRSSNPSRNRLLESMISARLPK
jgi:hypothetical protein